MKTLTYIKVISLSLATIFNACSSDEKEEPQPQSAQLSISTSIQTKAVITAFAEKDKMNLYVKSESSVTSADKVSSVYASYENSKWNISPTVELKEGEKAYLFAFYPYSSSLSKPEAIPIEVAAQTDYLYSGSATSVSYSAPQGVLRMQHALSIIAFNISKDQYDGNGKLSSIKMSNIPIKGTLNIESGVVSNTENGNFTIATNKQINGEWAEDLPHMFCIPFNSNGQDISAALTIDGIDYTVNLPKTNIETGIKYIYHLVITNKGVVILTELTEKISLNKEGTPSQLGEYGMLRINYSGKSVSAPILSGTKSVMGMIYWGDNTMESYASTLTHTYSTETEHSITVETWGANQLEITDLKDVESVDISNF